MEWLIILLLFLSTLLAGIRLNSLAQRNNFYGNYRFSRKNKKEAEPLKVKDKAHEDQLIRQQSFAFKLYVAAILLGFLIFIWLIYLMSIQSEFNANSVISGLSGIGEVLIGVEARRLYMKATETLQAD